MSAGAAVQRNREGVLRRFSLFLYAAHLVASSSPGGPLCLGRASLALCERVSLLRKKRRCPRLVCVAADADAMPDSTLLTVYDAFFFSRKHRYYVLRCS